MKLLGIIKDMFGPSHEWDWHRLQDGKTVIGFDGKPLNGWMMRRKVNGEIQYRAYTQAELDDREKDRIYFEAPP